RNQSAEVWMALSGSDDHPLCDSDGTLSSRAMDWRIHPHLFPLGVGVISTRFGALSLAIDHASAGFGLEDALFKSKAPSVEPGYCGGAGHRALGALPTRPIPGGTRDWITTLPVCRSRPEACGDDNNGRNAVDIADLSSAAYESHSDHPGS